LELKEGSFKVVEESIFITMLKNNNNPSSSFIANIKAITSSVVSG
jgi:hypothetical protein